MAERALFLWNSESLINRGVLSKDCADVVLPAVFAPLQVRTVKREVQLDTPELQYLYFFLCQANSHGHWNTTVETLAQVN